MDDRQRIIDMVLNVLLVVFALMFLTAVTLLGNYYLKGRQQEKMNQEIISIRQEALQDFSAATTGTKTDQDNPPQEAAAEPDASSYRKTAEMMRQLNPDYVCFLTLDDEHMYPVVQKDNAYYLKKNFKGERNSRGTIFVDETCREGDEVYLLHGHHMKDGSMFGVLPKYMDSIYRTLHRTVYLDFGEGNMNYDIIAIGLFDLAAEDHFPYYELPENGDLQEYLENFFANAWWGDKIPDLSRKQQDIEQNNQSLPYIVLLSTCEYRGVDQRLVIMAVRK